MDACMPILNQATIVMAGDGNTGLPAIISSEKIRVVTDRRHALSAG